MSESVEKPKCCAPFNQLTLRPDGNVVPCCHLYNWVVGNSAKQSIEEIWQSPKLEKLRQDLLHGNAKICKSRMYLNSCHQDFDYMRDWQEAYQSPTLKRLDMRLNGQCNLKCVMCEVWQEPNGKWDNTDIWSLSPDVLTQIREIDLLGGEPFIQKDTYKLFEYLGDYLSHISFGFVTNGQMKFSKRISNILEVAKIRYIEVSIDAVSNDTYEKIRLGGTLDKTLSFLGHVDRLRKRRGFEIRVGFCTQRANIYELPHFIRWAEQHVYVPDIQFAHYDPSQKASFNYADNEELESAIGFLNENLTQDDRIIAQECLKGLEGIKQKRIG